MITIFEGPRNSGKTYLANKFAYMNKATIFKFDFVGWFNSLSLKDDSEATHLFALGKEAMLLQLNRDGMLPDFVLDRGFLTVLSWGILSGRISEEIAKDQLKMLAEKGLLENCRIVYVFGENPNKEARNKDNWDHRDGTSQEQEILEDLRDYISNQPFNVEVIYLSNTFDNRVNAALERI
jgi:hypothetical protein